jgi:TBC1 domain family member 14
LDVFLLEGDSFLFRLSLSLLETLETRLFNPSSKELLLTFRAEDEGARKIVRREKGIGEFAIPGSGGEDEEVEVEDVYAQMGAKSERVWECLEKREWKEETWRRLVEVSRMLFDVFCF